MRVEELEIEIFILFIDEAKKRQIMISDDVKNG